MRDNYILIGHENFAPSLAVQFGKKYMRQLLDAWEREYHKDVSETFNQLRELYL